jgi:hypothetical protein
MCAHKYDLFSVDDHIVEPADVWSSRVPAKFRRASGTKAARTCTWVTHVRTCTSARA